MATSCGTAIVLLIVLSASSVRSGDTCYTLAQDVYITRETTYESSDGNEVLVTCTGSVTLRKCEGMCESQSLPSVVQFPGFKQECKCCREARLVDRQVILTECYDDSQPVLGQAIEVTIKEPDDCRCFECAS